MADSTSCASVARLSAFLPPSNHDSANYSNNQLENNQAAKMAALQLAQPPRSSHSVPSAPDVDLRFHPVRGSDLLLSAERSVTCTHAPDAARTLAFSDRPIRHGETFYVEAGHAGSPGLGALVFGMTSCDPSTLHPSELPAEPDALLDRKEYWVVRGGFPPPAPGDVLSFTLTPGGEVHHGTNGVSRGRLLCVDSTQALWAFFTLRGTINRLRILGTNQQQHLDLK